MEAPPEERHDSLKTSDTEVSDTTTSSSSVISPKRPIQLGIVQSSTGARASLGNLSLMKKSRWDQAPGSGENEDESKEANIQSKTSEETNIKRLIQKFEDISESSKLERDKPDEGSSSKPGRVKLVRTNFTKPEKPIAKPIDSDKVNVEMNKIEEADVKTINTSSEIPVTEVISVSSSKALQIISSNYDSPSDESSQEADNITISAVQEKKPSDSAYASLERLPDGNNHGKEEEKIEERLSPSLPLKSELVPKSGDNKIKNKNSDVLSSKPEDLSQKDFVEGIAEQTITINTVECEMSAKDSQIKKEGVDIGEGASQEVITDEINNKTPDQLEKEFDEKVLDEPSDSIQHITQSSNLLNENIPSGKNQTQEDSLNLLRKKELRTEKSCDDNLVSEITDSIKHSVSEINSVQAQLETIELAGGCKSNSSENISEINEPVEKVIDSKDGKTKSSLSDKKVSNEVNVVIKPSDEVLPSETNRLCEEDFVKVTHADVEDYKVDNESASGTDFPLVDEVVESSKISNFNSDNNMKDKSSIDSNFKESDSDGENSETVEAEQIECMVNKPTEDIQIPRQTSTELIETLDNEVGDKVPVLENENLEEIVSGKGHACEKPQSDEDTSHVYSDGVDAKMELIFSDNLGNVSEETCSSKQNVEEKLISVTHELVEENAVSEDLVSSDKASKPEDSENIFESNDSLLKILQSEGSPEAVACRKNKNGSEVEVEVIQNVEVFEKCNIEESVPINNVTLNDNFQSHKHENVPDQSNLITEEANLISGKNGALTDQVALDPVDIEDAESEKTCSEEKSDLQVEVSTKIAPENVANEETTSDLLDSESGLELKNKDLDINSHIIDTDKNVVDGVTNLETQNLSTDISFDTMDNQSLRSKSLSENIVQVSNFESNASKGAHIEEDRQVLLRDKAGDFKESEIVIEEVQDVHSSDIISDDGPQILEEEVLQKYDVTLGGKDSTDPQVGIEVPEISKHLVTEKTGCIDNTADSKITQVTENFEMQDPDVHSPKDKDVITKPTESDAVNESDELRKDENVSNLISVDSIEATENDNLPENSIPIEKVVNEIKSTNQEDTNLADKGEFKNQNRTDTQKCDPEKDSNIFKPASENDFGLNSNSIENLIVDSPGSSHSKEQNESKELPYGGDASVSDSHSNPVDTNETLNKAKGSIEVRQQETIERSIDMFFEVPISEHPLKPILAPSASSSKDTILEVSSETKKLFSEEIQKEMLKLSPEHEAQCELETINLPDPSRLSPSVKGLKSKNPIKSEENVIIMNDSCELSEESTLDNEVKMAELSVELEREKEILMPSDDSDIATIQAIDSFLDGDSIEINQSSAESNSKSEDLSIESVDENNIKITSNEEGSNNLEGTASSNERTNAEDVMLGVEGDLDLGNSLTYDTKKLDLSPSSEQSISEETYDLPGDSYDKESFEKEQESTNLLSDVSINVEASNKERDSELLTQISKENETEEKSLLKPTTVSEVDLKYQVRELESAQKDSGRESNKVGIKADIELIINKNQSMVNTSETKVDLSKDKVNEDSSMTGESKNDELYLIQKSVDSKIEGPKSNLGEEKSSELCGRQAYKTTHEQEVKELPKGESIETCEENHESAEIKVSHATSNEPKPQTSGCKDVDFDFENLIPSSTVVSKKKAELDISSTKAISCNIEEEFHGNLVNVSKELGSKKELISLRKFRKSEVIEDVNSRVTKDSLIEQDKKSEEFKFLRAENTSTIVTEKEDEKVSPDDIPSEINNKTSKRQCSTIEEIDHVNTDQDKITSDINKGPKRLKKTKKSEEIKFELSEKHIKLKTDSNIKDKSTSSAAPCQTLQESSKEIADNKLREEVKSIPLATSTNQARVPIAVEFKSSKEDTPDKSYSNKGDKSTPPKDPFIEIPSESQPSHEEQKITLDSSLKQTSLPMKHVESESSKEDTSTKTDMTLDVKFVSSVGAESKSASSADLTNEVLTEAIPPVLEQAAKPSKPATSKEIPAPVRVSARQKQRQAAALAAKEKAEEGKSPGQCSVVKKGSSQEKQGDKRGKKSLSPTKELHIKISGKSTESGIQSPLASQKSPKNVESKINLQISPKKMAREVSQDKLEPITLKLSKEENPVIVRSSSLSPKKNVAPHSPQGKTLGYTLKIGKDSTTIIPKDSTPSPTRRESSPGSGSTKADLSGKVGYLIKDTGLTITPVAPTETQEQKLNKITLKLSKAGGHPEIKQENKSETWKAIRKLGEIDIVPVEGKSPNETPKRKDNSEERSPEKKIKLGDVTVEPSTSSGVSKLQGLLTQAPLNQSDSSEDGKFIGFGSPTEKVSPAQQQNQASYDIGMIRHDDSPQPPRKRGRPRKITSPDDIVHSVSVPHSLPSGLTAKDILAASLQHQSLQQHLHPSYQPPQNYQPPEDLDSSQPMVPLFDLFEETFMEPTPPTIFPDQVQPSTEIIMRSARGRPIGRSRRPRGSGLMRGHERGGPRGRPRGSRGMKRILEEMEAMSFPDPDQPITLENIDAEMGPRVPEHAASELTMALLRKSIEGKKEILEKKARRSDESEEGNSDLDAMVREMKEKIEAAYLADRKSPVKEGKKRTPEKLEFAKKSPPGLIPINQKQDERRKSAEKQDERRKSAEKQDERRKSAEKQDERRKSAEKQDERRKSAEGKETVKRKLSVDKSEEGQQQVSKRKSTDEPESSKSEEVSIEESAKEDSQMEVDQPAMSSEDPSEQEEIKTEPEPPPKPVKPRPKSKAEIKRIKREKDRLRREAKKLAALEALKAPPPNPCEEDTRMSASDPNEDGEGSGIKKNRMEVGDPEGKEFTVEQIAEYQWPLQGGELYMIQEQISTWLGVKSFQRKYPDLKRRRVEMEERTYLCDSGLVAETMCDLGLTAVSSSELLDIMFQDFPDQYEELRKHMREKQARDIINKQKEKKKFEQTLSKSDLKEHAIQSLVSWNSNLNKGRSENRKCHLDLQTWTIQYPRSKAAKMTRPSGKLGSYPVALIPGQYADYYKRYTPQELRYFPVNTVLYGPLQPNEMHSTGGSDGSQSESEDSSSSDGSSDSSSEGEGEGTEEDEKERERERECKTCGSKKANEAMLQCSQCSHNIHVTCADLNPSMLAHVRKYQWQCSVCKTCQRCDNAKNESKMLFCDLCDRGYHSYCVGLRRVPAGSWSCELCTTGSETS